MARLDHPHVKILGGGGGGGDVVERVPASHALRMAQRGEYEWGGNVKRVRWMRATGVTSRWHKCWRTANAAVLYPSESWAR